jgi:hypothetical protein
LNGVSTIPGARLFTLMLRSASSSARVRVNIRMAPLEKSQLEPPGLGLSACTDETLMILPAPPAANRSWVNLRQQKK